MIDSTTIWLLWYENLIYGTRNWPLEDSTVTTTEQQFVFNTVTTPDTNGVYYGNT